jgi:hypothetical protein
MKKTLIIMLLVIVAIQLILIVVGRKTADPLVGHWRHTDETKKETYDLILRGDGYFRNTVAQDGRTTRTITGKWRKEGRNLNYEYIIYSQDQTPVVMKDTDEIVEFSKDHCVLKGADGHASDYVRVK